MSSVGLAGGGTMTIGDIGTIANLLSAIAVLGTLIYLSRQVKQGNLLARAHARERMVQQTNEELYQLANDANLRECFVKQTELSREEQGKLHFFLIAAMRQREWEWFQCRDGVIDDSVAKAYFGIIGLHLGTQRTRHWWSTVGRVGFNPEFVAEVDCFLADRPITTYFEEIICYDSSSASNRGAEAH
jgi:hypothetical protein